MTRKKNFTPFEKKANGVLCQAPSAKIWHENFRWALYSPVWGVKDARPRLPTQRAIETHLRDCRLCQNQVREERAVNQIYKLAVEAKDKDKFWEEVKKAARKEHRPKKKPR